MIGYYRHQCSCVRYVSDNDTLLIVCLTVGLAVLLIIVLIIIIVSIVCRRDRRRTRVPQQQVPEYNAAVGLDDKDGSYSRKLPDDYRETGMDGGYSRQLPDNHAKSTPSADFDKNYARQLPHAHL